MPWTSAALMASLHRPAEPPQAPRSARVRRRVRRRSHHRSRQSPRQPKDTSRNASSPQRSRRAGCDRPQVMALTAATHPKTARIPTEGGISPARSPCGGHRTGESRVSITEAAGKRMLRAELPPYSQPLRLPRREAASLRVTARSEANLVDVIAVVTPVGRLGSSPLGKVTTTIWSPVVQSMSRSFSKSTVTM